MGRKVVAPAAAPSTHGTSRKHRTTIATDDIRMSVLPLVRLRLSMPAHTVNLFDPAVASATSGPRFVQSPGRRQDLAPVVEPPRHHSHHPRHVIGQLLTGVEALLERLGPVVVPFDRLEGAVGLADEAASLAGRGIDRCAENLSAVVEVHELDPARPGP